MSIIVDIKPVLETVAKKMEARIRLQMPNVTGELQQSLSVYVTSDNEIVVEYAKYGMYTNYGTGPYKVDDIDKYEGYTKAKGGIRAQEWSAIPETTIEELINNVDKEIDKELDKVQDISDIAEIDFI